MLIQAYYLWQPYPHTRSGDGLALKDQTAKHLKCGFSTWTVRHAVERTVTRRKQT